MIGLLVGTIPALTIIMENEFKWIKDQSEFSKIYKYIAYDMKYLISSMPDSNKTIDASIKRCIQEDMLLNLAIERGYKIN